MAHKHEKHVHCEHEEVAFCGHCDVAYCKSCNQEWGVCNLSHGWYYPPYCGTTTVPIIGNDITLTGSNGITTATPTA